MMDSGRREDAEDGDLESNPSWDDDFEYEEEETTLEIVAFIDYDDDRQVAESGRHFFTHPLELLLHSVLHSDATQLMKRLELGHCLGDPYSDESAQEAFKSEDGAHYFTWRQAIAKQDDIQSLWNGLEVIKRANVDVDSWHQRVLNAETGLALSLLVPIYSGVKALRFSNPSYYRQDLNCILEALFDGKEKGETFPSLSILELLHYRPDQAGNDEEVPRDDGEPESICFLAPWLSLPSLRTIRCYSVKSEANNPLINHISDIKDCPVDHLEFDHCGLDIDRDLRPLLSRLTSLRTFKYSHAGKAIGGHLEMDVGSLGDDLRAHHAKTLDVLILVWDDVTHLRLGSEELDAIVRDSKAARQVIGNLGNLQSFKALRMLEVDLDILVGKEDSKIHLTDVLPPNLEQLLLHVQYDDYSRLSTLLEGFAPNSPPPSLPHLKVCYLVTPRFEERQELPESVEEKMRLPSDFDFRQPGGWFQFGSIQLTKPVWDRKMVDLEAQTEPFFSLSP